MKRSAHIAPSQPGQDDVVQLPRNASLVVIDMQVRSSASRSQRACLRCLKTKYRACAGVPM
jgi:hypothetical protein